MKRKRSDMTDVREMNLDEISNHYHLFDYTDGADFAITFRVDEFANQMLARSLMNVIVVCTQGWLHFDINGIQHTLNAGQVLILPSHLIIGTYEASNDMQGFALCLSDRLLFVILNKKIDLWIRSIFINNIMFLELTEMELERIGLYSSLCHNILDDKKISDRLYLLKHLVALCVQDVCNKLKTVDKEPLGTMQYSKQLFYRFMTILLKSEVKRHPVQYYAKELSVTPKYLSVVCTKYSGITTLGWIERLVMGDVRYYLRCTDMSAKDIADVLGFPNNSFFGRYVARNTGMSPSQYRKSLR